MMTHGQTAALTAPGESEMLEFKETTGTRREATMTVCAFLNLGGGQVLGEMVETLPQKLMTGEIQVGIWICAQRMRPTTEETIDSAQQRRAKWKKHDFMSVPNSDEQKIRLHLVARAYAIDSEYLLSIVEDLMSKAIGANGTTSQSADDWKRDHFVCWLSGFAAELALKGSLCSRYSTSRFPQPVQSDEICRKR